MYTEGHQRLWFWTATLRLHCVLIHKNYNIWLYLYYELTNTHAHHENQAIQLKLHRAKFSKVVLFSFWSADPVSEQTAMLEGMKKTCFITLIHVSYKMLKANFIFEYLTLVNYDYDGPATLSMTATWLYDIYFNIPAAVFWRQRWSPNLQEPEISIDNRPHSQTLH